MEKTNTKEHFSIEIMANSAVNIGLETEAEADLAAIVHESNI